MTLLSVYVKRISNNIIRAIPPNGCHLCPQDTVDTNMHIKINYKIHFIIKQSVLQINLTANVKYVIKKVIKNYLKHWKYNICTCPQCLTLHLNLKYNV